VIGWSSGFGRVRTGDGWGLERMTDTLWLIGGLVCLVLALAGTVAGWIAVGRMRRWRLAQAAQLPLIHAECVEARHAMLQQAFEVDRQAQALASRLDTGGRDMAVFLLSQGFSRLTGRPAGFWGPVVARMLAGRMGAGDEGPIERAGPVRGG
jgi:hypothetical protein